MAAGVTKPLGPLCPLMSVDMDHRWVLTGAALERLLERLGDDPQQAARAYDVIRRRLGEYFERRGCPDALADETIDRVARKLDQGETIRHLKAYLYGVASRVMLEWEDRQVRELAARREYPRPEPTSAEQREARIACLERCLRRLPRGDRALILAYYLGGKSERRRLAESLCITSDALRTRVCRVRIRLEPCLRRYLAARGLGSR